jgi:HemY protein
MKQLFWVLAILGLAVALTVAAKFNTGYVVVVYPPYRAEFSLSLAIFLLLALFVLAYGLLRLGINTLNLPAQVRAFREEQRRKNAHATLLAGVREFAAGRHIQAEKRAAEALELGEDAEISALVAARSAHALGAFVRRDTYLAQVDKTVFDYPDSGMAELAPTLSETQE